MKVNKTTYIMVALILGGLGVHKFYTDQVGQDILHLVFLWAGIPSVVAIIHAIVVIFAKKTDEYGYITFDKKQHLKISLHIFQKKQILLLAPTKTGCKISSKI